MKKIKVTHFLGGNLEYGGVEVSIMSLFPEILKKFEYNIVVVGSSHDQFTDSINPETLRENVFSFNKRLNLKNIVLDFFRVVKEIKTNKPDIIILSLWKSVLFYCLIYPIYRPHKIILFAHSVKYTHFFDKYFNLLGIGLSNKIFADSRATSEMLKLVTKKNIETISLIRSRPKTTKRPVSEIKIIKLVTISRISSEKGFTYIFLFLERLIHLNLKFKWDIIGSVSELSELNKIQSFIIKHNLENDVCLKGTIPPNKIFEYMSNYDFFIQFSLYEGMALSVAEAMSYGLVCIVNPVGEIPYYSQDMNSAIYINGLNSEGIDDVVCKLLKVLGDQKLYNNISQNAINSFKSSNLFIESFVDNLNL